MYAAHPFTFPIAINGLRPNAASPIIEGSPCLFVSTGVKIKKNKRNTKFKVRCSKYLYTLVVKEADKVDKLKQSLPPGMLLLICHIFIFAIFLIHLHSFRSYRHRHLNEVQLYSGNGPKWSNKLCFCSINSISPSLRMASLIPSPRQVLLRHTTTEIFLYLQRRASKNKFRVLGLDGVRQAVHLLV